MQVLRHSYVNFCIKKTNKSVLEDFLGLQKILIPWERALCKNQECDVHNC